MKKIITISVLILAVMGLLIVVSGCGGKKQVMKEVITKTPPPLAKGAKETGLFEVTAPEYEVEKEIVLGTIYFDFDKSNIKPEAQEILNYNGELLTEKSNIEVEIEGHCDERGTIEYNMALGERRAKAAKDYLVNYGIDNERLKTKSYGEERPADPKKTEEAYAKNRRAEFVITEK